MGCRRESIRAALICSLLAGCAHITPRDNPPDDTFIARSDLNATTACVVAALDGAVPGFPHGAVAIVPNASYEVRPLKELVTTGEVYFVRVASAPGGTQVQTYVISTWKSKIVPAVRRCGA
jgi:hypothetical protein